MWRWYTAEDRRQTAAVVLLLTVCGLTLGAAAPIFAGLAMSMIGTGSLGAARNPGRWPVIVSGLWTHPHDPAAAFRAASFSPLGFWLLASAVLLVSLGAYGWFATVGFRILAPTGTGFASRADIARDLSLSACRRRAKITRPDLDRRHGATAPAAQVAIPLHEAPVSRSPLWLPLENATGVIAPQQSGKTLMDLIHKVIDAPGGLITTSTKLDLFLLTARARERGGSPVEVLDLTGAAN